MDFVREKEGSLAVSLLKTLRLEEPFFLFISLVESHTLARTRQKYASAVQKWVRGA
jgi:hypothetical protein